MRSTLCTSGKFIIVWSISASLWVSLWGAFADLGGWPSNDDPFYAKPLYFWSNDAQWKWVKQNEELTASSVAHQAFGFLATFGPKFSYRSLFLICIAQQSFGIAALYCTSRALGSSIFLAFLTASSLALFPLNFGHAFTFMTDGPATAWGTVACCCGVLGVVRDDWRWLFLASCAIGWGFWIRQTNGLLLLAPFVTWVILFLNRRAPHRATWIGLLALLTPAVCSFALLESGWLVDSNVSRFQDISPTLDVSYLKEAVIAAYGAILLIGWFMLPWMFIAVHEASFRVNTQSLLPRYFCFAVALLTFVVSVIPFALTAGDACLTNSTGAFIQNAHFGPIFLSDMDEPERWSQLGGVSWPLLTWKVLSILAIANSTVLAWWFAWTICEFISQVRFDPVDKRMQHLAVAIGLLASTLFAAMVLVLFVEPHMDRYWLFVLAAIAVWWLIVVVLQHTSPQVLRSNWRWSPSATGWAIACLMLNAGMSTIFTHDMLAWNNARWQYVNSQLENGLRAEAIDGGRDVNAWLRLDEDVNSMPREGDTSPWWSGRAERSLAVGDRPGWHEIDRLPWSAWATGREHYLVVLERDRNPTTQTTSSINP